MDALVELDARPVLNTLEQVERWRGRGRALLHLDTGMNRLGLSRPTSLRSPRDRICSTDLELDFVMTHLACADEPEHPHERRAACAVRRLRGLLPPARTSIGNSAGTFIDAAHRGDLVRPGIALYGGNPFSDRPNPMARVVTLTAPILQLREIGEPQTVGYGATYVANPPARLAVVGIGYADGYPRNLGNVGSAAVARPARARRRPRIDGPDLRRIVGALPREAVRVGDPVELIGATVGLDEVAAAAGTISYEILTGFGHRLVRDYVESRKA